MNLFAGIFYGFRLFWGIGRGRRPLKKYLGAVLGIAFCLVPLILVLEVSEGMIAGITDRYLELGSFHFQIRSYFSAGLEEEEWIEKIAGVEGVERIFPFREGVGLIWSNGKSRGTTIRAYKEDLLINDPGYKKYLYLIEGSLSLPEQNSILISEDLAEFLKAVPGNTVRIVTGRSTPRGGIILRPTDFHIQGIFSTGYRDLDRNSVVISYEAGSALFREPSSFGLGLKVGSPYKSLDQLESEIRKALPPNWQLYSWYELEKPMYKSFQTTKNLLTFLMVLILLVAGVNISGVIVMTVLEKQQEIAVLKSVGVSTGTIRLGFLTVGFLCGFSGTLLGVILGILGSLNINSIISFLEQVISLFTNFSIPSEYYLETIPVSISLKNLFFISLFSLGLSVLMSYFPAKKISRLKPLDILRKL